MVLGILFELSNSQPQNVSHYMSDRNIQQRSQKFQRNTQLEDVLSELNSALEIASQEIPIEARMPSRPPIMIYGAARSGSTLLMQWLSSLGEFGYPSNLISRFFKFPYFGVRVQQILTDFDKLGEFSDIGSNSAFDSALGKTKGTTAPNEFWYFWRRFFHFRDYCRLLPGDVKTGLNRQFVQEVAQMDYAFGKPVAFKAMIMNWHVDLLDAIFDKVIHIHIYRNPIAHGVSILNARRSFFENIETWYAFQPMPEFKDNWPRTPYHEIAAQVFLTNKVISEAFEKIAPERKLAVTYEDFCAKPGNTYQNIRELCARQGTEISDEYLGEKHFKASDKQRTEDWDKIEEAYAEISRQYGEQG